MKRFTALALVAVLAFVLAGCTAQSTGAVAEDGKRQAGGQEALYDPSTLGTEVEGEPNEEYLSAGLTYEENMWYYQQKSVAALYDQNGGLYTNDSVKENTIYIEIRRDDADHITEVVELTKEQFQERIENR